MQEENKNARQELQREIEKLIKKATQDQLDLVWRFMRRMLDG